MMRKNGGPNVNERDSLKHITILGGGPAGLAVGYYAKMNGFPFTIYEAQNQIGGNAITLKHGDFLIDSGAHRFHDKVVDITEEIKMLHGEELKEINIPTQIYHQGRLIDFPLTPLNLMRNIGLCTFAKAAGEVIRSRLKAEELDGSFKSFAISTYGYTIAERFLLNYSEKLWGAPCDKLSSEIAGKRLKGLDLKTFLAEAIFGQKVKTEHLEGSFYYPTRGFGAIVEKLGQFCGDENINRNSKITKILHNNSRIQAVEINEKKIIDTEEVVNTLPITSFLQIMEPKPPDEILLLANSLRYRDMILVAFFLNRESVTDAATVYFPDTKFPFTRVYEPKNRSVYMSPKGKTSLVAEIPSQKEDTFWGMDDDKLIQLVRSQLIRIGWITEGQIIDSSVFRLNYAYPILEMGYEEKIQKIYRFLKDFTNLKLSGRNGTFTYSWIHDMMNYGKEIIEGYNSKKK